MGICQENLRHNILNSTTGMALAIKHFQEALVKIEEAVKACGLGDIEAWPLEDKIRFFATIFSLDPRWPLAIADIESTMGKNQLSPTGARGVFQMTRIAMVDLLNDMERHDDELGDVAVGCYFLRTLFRRHKSIEKATEKYCAPADRHFYVPRVMAAMATAGTNQRGGGTK